jgi:hypothetical protein
VLTDQMEPERRVCALCGGPLRPLRWWQRLGWVVTPPPFHDPDGPDGDACRAGLRERLGLHP